MDQYATRRQLLTPVQQSHILTDIQQHQSHHHRFNLNHQNQNINQNSQNQFINNQKNYQGPAKAQFNGPQQQQQQRPFFPAQNGPVNNQFNGPPPPPQPTQNSFRVAPLNQQRPPTQFVANFQTNGQQVPQSAPQFVQQHFQRSVQNQLQNPGLNNNPQQIQPQSQQNIRFPQQQSVHITQTVGQQLPTITSFQGQAPHAQALVGQPQQIIPQQPQQIIPQQQQIIPSQTPFVGSQPISASLPLVNPSQQQAPIYHPYSGAAVVNNPAPNVYFPQTAVGNQQFIQPQQQQQQFVAQAPIFAQNFPVTAPQTQGQFIPSSGVFQQDPKLEEERYRLLKEKERIIQKHEQFVQKHQIKQQQKVQQLHQDFLDGQQKIKYNLKTSVKATSNGSPYVPRYTQSRGVLPGEVNLFQKAVQAYHEVNPTTASSTTAATSTTQATPISALASSGGDFLRTKQKTGKSTQEITINTQEQLEQLLQGQHVFGQLKNSKTKSKGKSTKGLGRDDLIKQLKLALAEQPVDIGNQNYTSEDIVLPDGQKVQVIRTSDPSLIPAGSNSVNAQRYHEAPSAQSASQFVDSSVLPPGSEYELVKQTEDGKLEPVKDVPNQKKVTFVYLEEQDDGSYKVQGVKGSGDKEAKTSGTEVDSILKRIKEGDIQLPGSVGVATSSDAPQVSTTVRQIQSRSTTTTTTTTPQPQVQVSGGDYDDVFYSTPRSNAVRSTNQKSVLQSLNPFASSPSSSAATKDFLGVTVTKSYRGSSTVSPVVSSSSTYTPSTYTYSGNYVSSSTEESPETAPLVETTNNIESTTLPAFDPSSVGTTTTEKANNDLTDILRSNGLHAMAKYLKQSGLDTILNETGPYTVFAPTDKAFRALLVQLGGPEKAEEKFKHNPRLLSGVSRIEGGRILNLHAIMKKLEFLWYYETVF